MYVVVLKGTSFIAAPINAAMALFVVIVLRTARA